MIAGKSYRSLIAVEDAELRSPCVVFASCSIGRLYLLLSRVGRLLDELLNQNINRQKISFHVLAVMAETVTPRGFALYALIGKLLLRIDWMA